MAKLVDQKTSLMDSALGPVSVTTNTYENYDVDDYVAASVQGKAESMRMLNKAATVDPLDVKGRPPVTVDGVILGGTDDAI